MEVAADGKEESKERRRTGVEGNMDRIWYRGEGIGSREVGRRGALPERQARPCFKSNEGGVLESLLSMRGMYTKQDCEQRYG